MSKTAQIWALTHSGGAMGWSTKSAVPFPLTATKRTGSVPTT